MSVRKRLSPAQGLIRLAVRNCLTSNTKPGQKLLLAVSGGADSLALAAACEFEAKKLKVKIAAAVIDHSLQNNSDKVAAQTAKTLASLGFEEVVVKKIAVGKAGGPEAAARTARYTALETLRQKTKSHFIVLGHTASDQAETVLLGLVRGSGSKSLSGMSEKTGFLLRPLLGIERATTEAFCKDSGIKYWSDPQNKDEKFLRVMIRKHVLPFLEKQLGGSVAASLVRTSDQLREDNTYLESQADKSFKKYAKVSGSGISFDAKAIEKLPAAILNRVIKKALDGFGSESSRTHVLAVSDLVLSWHGQKPLALPGVRVVRKGNTISFEPNRR
ncbi:MAG: tRNA lysidine(34) synthetase TilS [Actinobacteria bacterium]|uniref:tRNA(Ile)-lysidine synthetase n=1 Tax=freshwater metagenome TaxID=449393 RepID=A0A6J6JAW8_9ZZZZ|nr:tRNA lysidine(34) synthetase TilS [Actinomycetota bacterium]